MLASAAAVVDWEAWHGAYESEDSALALRLRLVREHVRAALDAARPGRIRAISVCAGQGDDVIGALAGHERRADVSARLVELDERNVAAARRAASAAGLRGVQAVAGDASLTDAYVGAVPADLVLVCGVLGNVSARDALGLMERLRELCARGATVVWTRHRHPPDLVPGIVAAFERAGFEQLALADARQFAVGANRLVAEPLALRRGERLFEFIGHEALWPHLGPSERAALSALFRADCSLVELVEAMRALPFGGARDATAQNMLSEGRGTDASKHLFLAQVLAQRFPHTRAALVHRVYTLEHAHALELYGREIADTVPAAGLVDVHRYVTLTLHGERVTLDVTLGGARWDGRSALAPACGPGEDFPAGERPDEDMRALEREHCDARARERFVAAVAACAAPPGARET